MRPKLSWKLSDYQKNNIEPLGELLVTPDKTEGELMEDEDVEEWVVESIKTFRIIKEDKEELFDELYDIFNDDVRYLVNLKKIKEGAAEEILNKDNFNLF